jgi:hypothetical protein
LISSGIVEAAQAGFDVGQRDVQLRRHQPGRHRGVDVAVHHDQAGRVLGEVLLQAGHGRRGLLGVAARAHAQVDVRFGQAELDEEHVGQALVVVLAGVDDTLPVPERGQRPDHRRGLDEVRPGPEHVRDGCEHRVGVPSSG